MRKSGKPKVVPCNSGKLGWIRIKLLLAAGGAEVVLLALVVTGELRRLFINDHLADRVNRQILHLMFFLVLPEVYTF